MPEAKCTRRRSGPRTIRTLVVDDSALVRDYLVLSLGLDERVEVVGTASDGRDALQKAAELDPDLVLMDIEMPRMGGLEAARRLKTESPTTRILIVSTHEERYGRFLAASVGADAFVSKTRDLADALVRQISRLFAP